MSYLFFFKPYKEKYFNLLALLDEVSVLICISLFVNTTYLNKKSFSISSLKAFGYIFVVIIELVLIMNLVFAFLYYRKRNPPEREFIIDDYDQNDSNKNKKKSKKIERKDTDS